MTQSRRLSIIETTLNIGSGVVIAWCLTYWVLPVFGYAYTAMESAGITAIYTGVSWVRSYLWRRVFA